MTITGGDTDAGLFEEPMLYPDIKPLPCIFFGLCEDENENWCPENCTAYKWKEEET